MKRGDKEAREVVYSSIKSNINRIMAMLELKEKENPKGEGVLVYAPRGAGLPFGDAVWLVLDGQGYALNGRAKQVTPSLPWPSEARAGVWVRTGLDRYVATEALSIVYEGETVL